MKLISFDVLLQALKERGLDDTYLVLERLFFEESIVIVDKEGNVLKTFFDEEEIFEYLESIQGLESIQDTIEEEL